MSGTPGNTPNGAATPQAAEVFDIKKYTSKKTPKKPAVDLDWEDELTSASRLCEVVTTKLPQELVNMVCGFVVRSSAVPLRARVIGERDHSMNELARRALPKPYKSVLSEAARLDDQGVVTSEDPKLASKMSIFAGIKLAIARTCTLIPSSLNYPDNMSSTAKPSAITIAPYRHAVRHLHLDAPIILIHDRIWANPINATLDLLPTLKTTFPGLKTLKICVYIHDPAGRIYGMTTFTGDLNRADNTTGAQHLERLLKGMEDVGCPTVVLQVADQPLASALRGKHARMLGSLEGWVADAPKEEKEPEKWRRRWIVRDAESEGLGKWIAKGAIGAGKGSGVRRAFHG